MMREAEEEVTNLLSDLIKIDTTNPPGRETDAARCLAANLGEDGFECDLFESAPGRGNLVTRLQGTGERPNLLLLSHLDVVAADPNEWTVDPFGGVVKDGFVWGRGALDMKSMTAVEALVMKLLKRNKVKLKGDVILAATADEEKGGEAGAGWIVKTHPEKVHAKYVINEGGGLGIPMDEQNLYTVQTAEKGILWLRIRAKGKPGHGSVPGLADNAVLRMGSIIKMLGSHRSGIMLVPTVREFIHGIADRNATAKEALSALLENLENGDEVLDMIALKDQGMAEELRAMLRMTVSPTIVHGGVKENIIPSVCEAVFDCRVLPGQSPSDAMNEIKSLLGQADIEKLEFETIQANDPSESSMDTPLYKAIVDALERFDPEGSVVPILLTGGTDSRFFRSTGSVCYGFQPMKADMPYNEILKSVHGIDERISVENLVFGTSVLYNVVEDMMT